MPLGKKQKNITMGALAAAVSMASGTAPAATFTVSSTASGGVGSLAFAMGLAGDNGEDDTINITATGTMDLSDVELPPHFDGSGSLTIVGPGKDNLTIIGRDFSGGEVGPEPRAERRPDSPLFLSVVSQPLSISGLTISGADAGAVVSFSEGSISLDDVRITGSDGEGKYGQVFAPYADVTITDSTFDSHSGRAPVITVFGGSLDIDGSELIDNENLSAAVFALDADVEITDSVISGNTNPEFVEPGGIEDLKYLSPGVVGIASEVVVRYSVFENNSAEYGAGAGMLLLPAGVTAIENSSFSGNRASTGGAVAVIKYGPPAPPGGGLPVIIEGSSFVGNEARVPTELPEGGPKYGAGGAILVGGGLSFNMGETVLTGNSADTYGGAVAGFALSGLNIENSLVEGNDAGESGGGLVIDLNGLDGRIAGSTIRGNSSANGTGGVEIDGDKYGDFEISQSTISDNQTAGTDGAVSGLRFSADGEEDDSTLTISQSTISGNAGDGPAVHAAFYDDGGLGSVNVENSTFSGNASDMERAPVVFQGFDYSAVRHSTFIDNAGVGVNSGQVHIAATSTGYSETSFTLERSVLSSSNDVEVILNASDLTLDGGYAGTVDSLAVTIENTVMTQGDLGYSESTSINRIGVLADDGFGIDPGLGALANNGGPTLTHAPLSAMSAVVDAVGEGGNRPDGVDQRGVAEDFNVDLGAVEYVDPVVNTAPTLVVNIGSKISGNVGFVLPEPIPVADAFEDAEEDNISVVSVLGLPPGLEYNEGSIIGELATQGEYQVKVTVADDGEPSLSTTATFDVTVGDGEGPSDAELAALLDDDDDSGSTPLAFFGTLAALAWLRRRRR
jgi:hypothetical protein